MASSMRCLSLSRNLVQRTSTTTRTRLLSTSPILRNDAASSPNLGTVSSSKKPIGGFRGGFGFAMSVLCVLTLLVYCSIIGFLFGFSLASTYAAYHLLDEYKAASAALQASVEELQATTAKVRSRAMFVHTCSCVFPTGNRTCAKNRSSGKGLESPVPKLC